MLAQSQRLNIVASNMANADSATSPDGQPYQAKQIIFSAVPMASGAVGVRVENVVNDTSPAKMVYEPKNPLANAKGFVAMPNVNVIEEMVNMISASRSYQNDVDMMNTAKTMLTKTLTMGQ